jgi:Transposase DDE domain
LASLVGQDLEEGGDGVFRIARRVAKDRVISTVDPDARHGHKTSARGCDGYKGHVAVDPDSELISSTTVTAGNAGDASAASELLAYDLGTSDQRPPGGQPGAERPQGERPEGCPEAEEPHDEQPEQPQADESLAQVDDRGMPAGAGEREDRGGKLSVYGDSAYGAGELIDTLERADAEVNCKVQPPVAPGGHFAKDAFTIDLQAGTVTCPAAQTTALRRSGEGQIAHFGQACASCPLADRCTSSKGGRTVYVGPFEQQLTRARERQSDPAWKADYTATRPKVERKIARLMHRRHGGRRARVRGQPKVKADFALLAAAINLARLAVLGLTTEHGGWQAQTA